MFLNTYMLNTMEEEHFTRYDKSKLEIISFMCLKARSKTQEATNSTHAIGTAASQDKIF